MDAPESDVGNGGTVALLSEQARSPQPWVSQVSADAVSQVRNIVQRKGKHVGSSKSRRFGEDALSLVLLQQQLDELEDRFSLQLQRLQIRSDRLHEAETQRWEERLGITENSQLQFAELTKAVEELSAQLSVQVRRIDKMDEASMMWRSQMDKDIKEWHSSVQEMFASIDVTELRCLVQDHDCQLRTMHEGLHVLPELMENAASRELMERCGEQTESIGLQPLGQAMDAPLAPDLHSPGFSSPSGRDSKLSKHILAMRATDLDSKVENLHEDSCDISARLNAQEERLRSLRTWMESSNLHAIDLKEQIQEVLDQVDERCLLSRQILEASLGITNARIDTLEAKAIHRLDSGEMNNSIVNEAAVQDVQLTSVRLHEAEAKYAEISKQVEILKAHTSLQATTLQQAPRSRSLDADLANADFGSRLAAAAKEQDVVSQKADKVASMLLAAEKKQAERVDQLSDYAHQLEVRLQAVESRDKGGYAFKGT